MRWENEMSPCATGVVAAPACENPDDWTEGQRRQYNNWQYSSTALKSCEKIIQKHVIQNPQIASRVKCLAGTHRLLNNRTWTPASSPYNADSYVCTCDWDHNTVTNDVDASYGWFPVSKAYPTPEPICSATPNGPYKDLYGLPPAAGTPGGSFADSLRYDVRSRNAVVHNGTEGTDLLQIEGPNGLPFTDPALNQWATRWTHRPYDDDHDPDTETMSAMSQTQIGTSLQIDHIIPRFDIQGCPCGTNSVANALVVSGTINNQMSNLIEGDARRAILNEWTNYFQLFPNARISSAGSDGEPTAPVDESPITSEVGGCSTTSGGGWGAILGIVMAVGGRRRRAGGASRRRTSRVG